jgi:hypothetical protein
MEMVTCKCSVCHKEFRVDRETLDKSPPGCSLGMRLEKVLQGFHQVGDDSSVLDVQIVAQVIPEEDHDLCYECATQALKLAVDNQIKEGD